MKVSIIIPTYKRPEFLKRAIDSAINQTYNDIEIIVVSDNEIDSKYEKETLSIISNYEKLDNFKYLPAIGNKGGCYARNRGLEVAEGEYVNFLDDDDIMHKEKIKKQVDLLLSKKEKIAVVGCYASILDSNGKQYRIEKPIYDKNNILFSELKHNICTTSINLINIDVCKKVGGFEYIESSQEHLFLIKIFNENPTFDYVNEILVDIDQHNGPRVSNNKRKPIGTLKLTKIIEKYYDQFDDDKIMELRATRMYMDIKAYCLLREYKNAIKLFTKRLKIKKIDKDNIKLLIIIIISFFGVKI